MIEALESTLDSKEIKPVNLKGNQPWILIGKTDAEAEAPVFWPPDVNSQLIGKDPDPGEDWRQKERRATEDEMVGWYYRFNEHELRQTLGDSEGLGGLACCSPRGHRDLVTQGQQQHMQKRWPLSRQSPLGSPGLVPWSSNRGRKGPPNGETTSHSSPPLALVCREKSILEIDLTVPGKGVTALSPVPPTPLTLVGEERYGYRVTALML